MTRPGGMRGAIKSAVPNGYWASLGSNRFLRLLEAKPPPPPPGPPRSAGPALRARLRGPRFAGNPPLGPQSELGAPPGPPFGIPVALPHAPGTPSETSKNHSKRKTKILKSAQFFHQKLSPGELLPIQDPPKGPPLDLIKFPEGLPRGSRRAQCTSQDPP